MLAKYSSWGSEGQTLLQKGIKKKSSPFFLPILQRVPFKYSLVQSRMYGWSQLLLVTLNLMFKCSEVVFTVSLSCPQITCPSWCFYHFLLHRDGWMEPPLSQSSLSSCCSTQVLCLRKNLISDTSIPRNPSQRAILSIRHQNQNIYFVYLVLCEGFCSDTELVCIHRNCRFILTNDTI